MPTSNASAIWEGGLKNGNGTFKAGSGAFAGSYSFTTRFAGEPGTNPEELIAAAHAACFSMALSAGLEGAGATPRRIETQAACSIEKVGEGFKITTMDLQVAGAVDGIDQADFESAAEAAKNGCPVSGALMGNVELRLNAKLE